MALRFFHLLFFNSLYLLARKRSWKNKRQVAFYATENIELHHPEEPNESMLFTIVKTSNKTFFYFLFFIYFAFYFLKLILSKLFLIPFFFFSFHRYFFMD